MKKAEFLTELRISLHFLPERDASQIVEDYEEYFAQKLESGFAEEEILRQLASPREIAEEIRAGRVNKGEVSRGSSFIVALALVFFNLVFILGPLLGVLGLIFGLFVTAISFILSPLGLILKLILGDGHLFEFFLSLVLAGLGLLLLPLTVKLVKFFERVLRKYGKWNIKMIRGEQ